MKNEMKLSTLLKEMNGNQAIWYKEKTKVSQALFVVLLINHTWRNNINSYLATFDCPFPLANATLHCVDYVNGLIMLLIAVIFDEIKQSITV